MTPAKKKPGSSSAAKAKPVASSFPYRLTHPNRVVYPDVGLTKRDLADYYLHVAERMLPHLVNRPISVVRCPEGMKGSCFYQKHPAAGMSDALDRIRIREKDEVDTYLVVRDVEGLVSLVQFGALEIHVWGSQADDVERPDRLVFDLDPDPAVGWPRVVAGALLLRDFLKELKLESFVKTTGGKGLHVVVPIAPKHAWPEVKQFCRAVAEAIAAHAPDEYLANMSKLKRRGKIFVDYLRNERGATAVAAYSTRARAGAPISAPISWSELKKLKSGSDFTVERAMTPAFTRRTDPWKGIAEVRQSIAPRVMKSLLSAATR